MKIKLINKDDEIIIAEYDADAVVRKFELITFNSETFEVDQVEYVIRRNKMAQENQIDYIRVTCTKKGN